MQNFNPQAQGQPTNQRDSFLFIECRTKIESNNPKYTDKILINPDDIKDIGIGTLVSREVQRLSNLGFRVENVYIGSLL